MHQCNEFRLPPFITTRRCQLTTLMVRVIRIIFTMMKIIMMIIIKSEILLMITTILKMMVFTVSHACMRVKHDDEKDGFKMIDLIFAGKGCEV